MVKCEFENYLTFLHNTWELWMGILWKCWVKGFQWWTRSGFWNARNNKSCSFSDKTWRSRLLPLDQNTYASAFDRTLCVSIWKGENLHFLVDSTDDKSTQCLHHKWQYILGLVVGCCTLLWENWKPEGVSLPSHLYHLVSHWDCRPKAIYWAVLFCYVSQTAYK